MCVDTGPSLSLFLVTPSVYKCQGVGHTYETDSNYQAHTYTGPEEGTAPLFSNTSAAERALNTRHCAPSQTLLDLGKSKLTISNNLMNVKYITYFTCSYVLAV